MMCTEPWKSDKVTGRAGISAVMRGFFLSPCHLVRAPGFRDVTQHGQLPQGKTACLAAAQVAKLYRADGDATQPHDLVAQPGQHAADLAILAFAQDDLEP